MNPAEFNPAWTKAEQVDWFLFEFSMISDLEWCTHAIEESDRHDAMGHCGARQVTNQHGRPTIQFTPAAMALMALTKQHLGAMPDDINDNSDLCPPCLRQITTPKARIGKAIELCGEAIAGRPIDLGQVEALAPWQEREIQREADDLRQEVREEVVDSIPL